MDVFVTTLLVLAAAFLGMVGVIGIGTLVQIRRRRERMRMKRHLQSIERLVWHEVSRRT